ncbi:MAG: endonuclease domain-containing protein [Candidatus Altimarinota bacterium]
MGSVIVETARKLRKRQTPAEKIFWEEVRDRRYLNKKFSRQFPIPVWIDNSKRYFIADFYCYEHRLIVEIDGSIHDEQKEYDEFRTEVLKTLGMKVIRFTNDEVFSDIKEVMKKLELKIKKSPSLEERG